MFEIGDRVYFKETAYDGKFLLGKTGTVIMAQTESWDLVGVQFDEHINGHSCAERGVYGYCWGVPAETLSLLKEDEFDAPSDEEFLAFVGGK